MKHREFYPATRDLMQSKHHPNHFGVPLWVLVLAHLLLLFLWPYSQPYLLSRSVCGVAVDVVAEGENTVVREASQHLFEKKKHAGGNQGS